MELLESSQCDVLPLRLAKITGRPLPRFIEMQISDSDWQLEISHRDAYCAVCWNECRREDAAYLRKDWARPWQFLCSNHPNRFLDSYDADEEHPWSNWFAKRSNWAANARRQGITAFDKVCEAFAFDSEADKQVARQAVIQYQDQFEQFRQTKDLSTEFRILTDMANYWQVAWSGPNHHHDSAVLAMSHRRDVYDADICYKRSLVGKLSSRIAAVILARLTVDLLGADKNHFPWVKQFLIDRRRTYLETWWLTRRFWGLPSEAREALHALFDLPLEAGCYVAALPPSCDACLAAASPAYRSDWLSEPLSDHWRCHYDA